MAKLEKIRSESELWHDVLIQVGFLKPKTANDNVHILATILDTLGSKEAAQLDLFLDGITYLELGEDQLTMRFRFLQVDKENIEDVTPERVNFILHLFAKIDDSYPLSDTPFGEEFRQLLDLASYYDLE
jgi:hypothetical protein